MMRYAKILALAIPAVLSACSWRRTPVPIVAESGSAALLVGAWTGDYTSKQTGRSGTITFELASEKDTAFCDIVMIPKVQSIQIVGERGDRAIVRPQASAEPLKIRFIRLGEGRISGTLEPYVDPDCGCRVTTTFDGKFSGPDTIEGTFFSRAPGGESVPSGGSWKVTRQKARAALE